jgi:transcriptional pleiotropic regulator of transition state genes
LGRIVLPMELRKNLDIAISDPLEIYVDGDTVILKKYAPDCIFCGNAKGLSRVHGKIVCSNCIKELKEE